MSTMVKHIHLVTYNDSARNDPTVSQLTRLGCKSGADERTPVVADNYTLPAIVQELLPQTDNGLRHGFKNLVGSVVWQTITPAISRQIDSNQGVGLLQCWRLKDMFPQQIRIREPMDEESNIL